MRPLRTFWCIGLVSKISGTDLQKNRLGALPKIGCGEKGVVSKITVTLHRKKTVMLFSCSSRNLKTELDILRCRMEWSISFSWWF